MTDAVKVKDLSVKLGTVQALNDVSLSIAEGKITGFIGPSGAGKTTLIKSIVGRLPVSKEAVIILGHPAGAPALRQMVSYMSQELSVYPDLTVGENLRYFAKMQGVPGGTISQSVQKVLQAVDIPEKSNAVVGELSGGQKQRVSLAVALLGSPKIMVLDEPTVGLDPVLREALWHLFHQIAAGGTTLIISSHSMDEARRCEDLVLLREGRIIAQQTPQELLRQTGTNSVEQAFLRLIGAAK